MRGVIEKVIVSPGVVGVLAPVNASAQLTLERKTLSLAGARSIVAAAEAEATARNVGVVIVVADVRATSSR